jgi:predicted GNAT family N-acyltransferase
MDVKFFPALSAEMADRVNRHISENFYAKGKRTPNLSAEEEEKFYSEPRVWILAFEKDQIIGTTALHQRKIQFNKKDIILGGIGRVCTRKDRRRQGIAALMLKDAIKTLKSWGCDVAFLCANRKESGTLYEQAGFIPLSKSYTYHGRSGKVYEESNGMIAPLKSPSIFKEIIASRQKLHLGPGNW